MEENNNIQIQAISTTVLQSMMNEDQVRIIDIRPVEAYNGWSLGNETRGGHIMGAKSLPMKWIRYIDWIEIVQQKDILPHHQLIIYGYEKEMIDAVAHHFQRAGYPQVFAYYDFINEWSTDQTLPMDHMKRYQHLVSAEWVHQLITTGQAPTFHNTKYVICHAHYQNQEDYEEGHIPQAIDVDTNLLESSTTWNRRGADELKKALESIGITHDTTVIFYGRFSYPDNHDPFPGSSAGHLGAMRCALIMLYAGVEDVRVLNGGLQSWLDAGYDTTTETVLIQPVDDFGTSIPAHPEYIIDTPEAKEFISSKDKNLVSVRSWMEFIGKVSGYHYIQEKGRIPGAVFGNCGSDAYHMENYRNLDHTTREYHEIAELWEQVGITPEKQNAFYCGTGWRGSEAFFNAWLMGWPQVSVYDGGWFEWSNQNNPKMTGIPDGMGYQLPDGEMGEMTSIKR